MALVGIGQAARLSGRNRSTLHRAMKDGRLSYSLDETGERRIDTTELDRVFGIKPAGGNGAHMPQSNTAQQAEVEVLRQWLTDRDETIRDLRQRLDAADHRLTALLARPDPPASAEPDPPRPLSRRILAWLARQHGW
jgi:hypothetical protein